MSSYRVLINLINKRYAGHSKWANIKHIKATKDAQRSAIFTKLSHQLKVAIQEGGSPNPEHNLKLVQIIEQAKRNCMPMATIQNVIKSTQLKKDTCKLAILDIKGPSGCVILCQVFTDNLTRVRQNLVPILKRYNASFSDGSGRKLFEQKGVVEVENPYTDKDENEIIDLAMEHAIESGAEDVKLNLTESLFFTCEPNQLRNVQTYLENLKYKILSSDVEYLPLIYIDLGDKELETLSIMCSKLENQEEVVKLYDNVG